MAHKTDWLRMCLLEKYGGVWLDASIVLNKPITTWLDMTEERVVGFQCPIGIGESTPVLENWALAAKPSHPFITMWKNELRKAIMMGYDAYKDLIVHTYPKHPIFDMMPYLNMHGAFLVVNDPSQVRMLDCFDDNIGPFKFTQQEWKNGLRYFAVWKMFLWSYEEMALIKLTGKTRSYAEICLKMLPIKRNSYMHRTLHVQNHVGTFVMVVTVLLLMVLVIVQSKGYRTFKISKMKHEVFRAP